MTSRATEFRIALVVFGLLAVLFVAFPVGLRCGLNFWASLVAACAVTALTYKVCQPLLDKAG